MHPDDEIRVGDRVRGPGIRQSGSEVVAIGELEAWVRFEQGSHGTYLLSDLTRIEPEKVALTPKYEVGQTVKKHGLGEAVSIENITVTYAVNIPLLGRVWWRESDLEAVPEPCDKCGK